MKFLCQLQFFILTRVPGLVIIWGANLIIAVVFFHQENLARSLEGACCRELLVLWCSSPCLGGGAGGCGALC